MSVDQETLKRDTKIVDKELKKLGLPLVNSPEEKALVFAAFETEGTATLIMYVAHVLTLLNITVTILITSGLSYKSFLYILFVCLLFAGVLKALEFFFTPRQRSLAITNIVNYRANFGPTPCTHENGEPENVSDSKMPSPIEVSEE